MRNFIGAVLVIALLALSMAATAKDGDVWACAMEGGNKDNPIRTITVYRVKDGWLEDTALAQALRESKNNETFIDTRSRSKIVEDTPEGLIAVRAMIDRKDSVTQVIVHAVLINKRHRMFRSTYVASPPDVDGSFLGNDSTVGGGCQQVEN
jgi:hypothetical protein